jgi:hypothetical protein
MNTVSEKLTDFMLVVFSDSYRSLTFSSFDTYI